MFKFLAAAAFAATIATAASAGTYVAVDFDRNADLFPLTDGWLPFTPAPGTDMTGNQGSSVPFDIVGDGNDVWSSTVGDYAGTKTLNVTTDLFGVDKIYTLINTFWGSSITGLTSITFNATNSVSQTFELTGGVEIRDFASTSFSNTTTSPNTSLWHLNDSGYSVARLDMQVFDLEDAFLSETLTSIVLEDKGLHYQALGQYAHRAFVAGITAEITPAVPLPGAAMLFLGALGSLGAVRNRRTRHKA